MSAPRSRVPRLPEAMLEALLDSGRREFVMGDLEEEYLNHRARRGAVNSYFWYWRHALGSIIAQTKSARASRSHAAAPRPAQRRTAGMFVSGLAGDAKFALRSLRQNPMFSIVAIGTLTLGIGANTAIFTVVDSVVLRQLPYEDAERVVAVWPEKGLLVAGAGVVAGLVGALGATRALSGLVFGIGTTDLSTFSLVPVVVLVVAGMACFVPARRASRVDPMVALRLE